MKISLKGLFSNVQRKIRKCKTLKITRYPYQKKIILFLGKLRHTQSANFLIFIH